jgi:hypothetical protein
MEKVLRDYRSRLQANSRETERIKMYIRIIAFLRLSVVVVAALIVYLFRNKNADEWYSWFYKFVKRTWPDKQRNKGIHPNNSEKWRADAEYSQRFNRYFKN